MNRKKGLWKLPRYIFLLFVLATQKLKLNSHEAAKKKEKFNSFVCEKGNHKQFC